MSLASDYEKALMSGVYSNPQMPVPMAQQPIPRPVPTQPQGPNPYQAAMLEKYKAAISQPSVQASGVGYQIIPDPASKTGYRIVTPEMLLPNTPGPSGQPSAYAAALADRVSRQNQVGIDMQKQRAMAEQKSAVELAGAKEAGTEAGERAVIVEKGKKKQGEYRVIRNEVEKMIDSNVPQSEMFKYFQEKNPGNPREAMTAMFVDLSNDKKSKQSVQKYMLKQYASGLGLMNPARGVDTGMLGKLLHPVAGAHYTPENILKDVYKANPESMYSGFQGQSANNQYADSVTKLADAARQNPQLAQALNTLLQQFQASQQSR